jgi:hypothetical protein
MSDFVLLYQGGSMPETDAEQAQVMDAWTGWFGRVGSALKDGGNPFSPHAKTISADGAVSDGTKGEPATGYTIVEADSIDEALGFAKDCPVLQGGQHHGVRDVPRDVRSASDPRRLKGRAERGPAPPLATRVATLRGWMRARRRTDGAMRGFEGGPSGMLGRSRPPTLTSTSTAHIPSATPSPVGPLPT